MYEKPLIFETYYEKQAQIAKRLVLLRKRKKVSQARLSEMSGVPFATIRRFEKTGEISLSSLIKIMMAFQLYDEIDNIFHYRPIYNSVEEIENEWKSKGVR